MSKVSHVAKELVGGFGLERVILLPSSVSGEYVDSNAVVQRLVRVYPIMVVA